MKTLAIVCLLVVILTSTLVPAFAGEREKKIVGGILAILLLSKLGGGTAGSCQQSAPPEERVSLTTSSRKLGDVVIKEVSGPNGARWATAEVLSAAGWAVVDDDARRAAEEERRRYGANGQNGPVPATHFAGVWAEFRDGSSYRRQDWGGRSQSGGEVREVICTLFLKISDSSGRTLAARATGSSWSQFTNSSFSGRHWGYSNSSYTPSDRDWAFLAALVKASNAILAQIPVAPAAATGSAGTPAGYCPNCGAQTPNGANYCPKCGKELPH